MFFFEEFLAVFFSNVLFVICRWLSRDMKQRRIFHCLTRPSSWFLTMSTWASSLKSSGMLLQQVCSVRYQYNLYYQQRHIWGGGFGQWPNRLLSFSLSSCGYIICHYHYWYQIIIISYHFHYHYHKFYVRKNSCRSFIHLLEWKYRKWKSSHFHCTASVTSTC